MKKIFAMLLVMMLACCACAFAEEDFAAFCNPNGYKLIRIYDVFTPDPEYIEDGEEVEEAAEETAALQVCFGDIDLSEGEANYKLIGFDEEDIFTLSLLPDATINMPSNLIYDPLNTGKALTVEEFIAWFRANLEFYENEFANDEGAVFTVLASFDMNAEGEVSRVEYFYVP